MGLVSSICKHRKPGKSDDIVHHNYTQTAISTANTSTSLSSDKTHCSAISREPTNDASSSPYHFYLSPQPHMYSTPVKSKRRYSDLSHFPTPFYLSLHDNDHISYGQPNPYIAHAYSYVEAPVPIHNTDRLQTNLSRATSTPDVLPTTDDEHRTVTRVESLITTETNEQSSSKKNLDDGSRLIKRSASAPIDMFLIDISNEHVLIGQPVSMNIRHLLLDTLQKHHTNSSTPIHIEPSSITTYAHENLLNYIPYVCERYPNVTVECDQPTRNTLHVRVPSEFSRSVNGLT